MLALPMAACGVSTIAATEPQSEASASEPLPAAPAPVASAESEAGHAHADHPAVLGDDAVSARIRETIAEVGARVVAVEAVNDGALPMVDLELGATRLRTPLGWQAVGALHAVAVIEQVRAQGIAPIDVRALREGRVWISSEPTAANDALLRRPPWLVAPSRRRRAEVLPDALGDPTREVAGTGETAIDALRVDATSSVMLVGALADLEAPSSSALCVAHADVVRCVAASYSGLEGLAGAWEGAARALVVSTVGGSSRDGGHSLLFVAEVGERVVTSELALGAMSGDGERCEHDDSYCVHVDASASDARWVADRCVEVDAPERWTGTHVRAGDRWRDVRIVRGAGCVRRFAVGPEGPRRERCGPARGRPECSDDDADE